MKDFLNKLIAEKEARANELRKLIQDSTDLATAQKHATELDGVNAELNEARAALAKQTQKPAFDPVATYGTRGTTPVADEMEKRLDFAKYVVNGVPTPEMRANATTTTGNVSAAIPQNLLNQIIEKIDNSGMILPLVTRTSYPVGQTILVDGVKPVASWVNEGAGSDRQAKTGAGTVVFSSHKLRCEIAFTQEVSVQTIAAFEALFVKQVSEAMVKAIESKIVSADAGAASPVGILYNASNNDKKIAIAKLATGKLTYKTLCDAEGLLPQEYEAGAKWFMSKKTFMSFVEMTDNNGQPIARVNYGIGNKPERTLLGRDVVINPYMADYSEAAATADVVFAFLFDPSDYVLNTSYDLGIQRKIDWDTEDHLVKAVMSCDGKVVDRGSLVKLVKAYQ